MGPLLAVPVSIGHRGSHDPRPQVCPFLTKWFKPVIGQPLGQFIASDLIEELPDGFAQGQG